MSLFNRLSDACNEFLFEQKPNFILWLPVFIGLGAALYFGQLLEPNAINSMLFIIPILIFGILAQYGFVQQIYKNQLQIIAAALIIIIALVTLGFSAGMLRTHIVFTPMVERKIPPQLITGTITHIDQKDDSKTIMIRMDDIKAENLIPEETPKSIRISSRLKNVELKVGYQIKALIALEPFKPPVSDHAFDFRRYYFFQGIGATGFLLKPPEAIIKPSPSLQLYLIDWRERLNAKIKEILPARAGGIVTALMTGERAAIKETDWDNLRYSGLAHIISISGLHVAMVATTIFFFTRLLLALIPFLALQFPIKKIAAMVALIGCSLYVGFVVPTVPTTRALLMTGIALMAILLDRSPFSLRLIALSAVGILLVLPESIWSASFQLSFAAVTLLVAAAEMTRPYWSKLKENAGFIRKIIIYVVTSILTTIIATIATAPFSSFHFGQIANYSVIANGLAIPLTAIIIMPMMIISFMALPFGLESLPLKLMGWGTDKMLDIAEFVAHLPHAVTLTPTWSFTALCLIAFAGIWFCFVNGRGKTLALLPLIIASIFIFTQNEKNIFVTAEHKLLMLKYQDEIVISSLRRENFAREQWLQFLGLPADASERLIVFPKEGIANTENIKVTCDRGACRAITPTQKITYGIDQYALLSDCSWADLIITEKYFAPKQNCKAKIWDRTLYKDLKAKENRPWLF